VAVSAEQFAAELRAFDGRRAIVRALRRALARAARPALTEARAHAIEILPHAGGLGAWVAAASMSVRISYAGRSAGVRLRGTRKSVRQRSDLTRIDAGTVRAPTYGRRHGNAWHVQAVASGWWSDPLENTPGWHDDADQAVDEALDTIRRG
jgi:hypothetical protein